MNRLIAPCPACECEVEWLRDHIAGPEHYRCGNCFEVIDLDRIDDLKALSDQLKKLEDQRHAILTANRLNRG